MMDAPDIVMCSLVLHWALLITALSVVCFWLCNQYRSITSECTVFLKHRTNWDNVCCALTSFTWSTILKPADPLDVFERAIGEVIGWLVPTTVLHSISWDDHWFHASCQRAYDAKQIAYNAWCRLRSANHWGWVVRAHAEAQRVYGAAGSHIMNALRILWSTPPVHISGGRHLKAQSLVWSHLFLLSGGSGVVWWWLLLRKHHSWALSLTVSSVVSSSSHLCLVSLSIGAILWLSGLLSFCICFLILTQGQGHAFGCVSSISKDGADIIVPKLGLIFCGLIRWGLFPECWQSANVTAIPKGAPSPDTENYHPMSITPILSKVYEKLVSCVSFLLSLLIGKVWATLMHC